MAGGTGATGERPWVDRALEDDLDEERARLNRVAHLLSMVADGDLPHEAVALPQRVFNPNYERRVLPGELCVPERH